MTKIIDLTKEAKEGKVLKPIEFVKYIRPRGQRITAQTNPSDFKLIELICRKYTDGYDLMFASDDNRNLGGLYLGHFNDGIL